MPVVMLPVESSAIEAIGYEPDVRRLHVKFKESGETYVYGDVDLPVYDAFLNSASKGRYFAQEIRAAYAYRRLPEAEACPANL